MNVIIDNDGQIVGDKDGIRLSSMLGFHYGERQQGIFSKSMDGEKKLVVYNRLETTIGRCRYASRRGFDEGSQRYPVVYADRSALHVSSIGILLAVFIASTVHRPLHKMIRAMRKAKNGDFDVRIVDKREDEFGYLFHSF